MWDPWEITVGFTSGQRHGHSDMDHGKWEVTNIISETRQPVLRTFVRCPRGHPGLFGKIFLAKVEFVKGKRELR